MHFVCLIWDDCSQLSFLQVGTRSRDGHKVDPKEEPNTHPKHHQLLALFWVFCRWQTDGIVPSKSKWWDLFPTNRAGGSGFKKASAIRILLLGIVPVTELVRTVNDFECAQCFSFLVGPSHGVPQGSRMKPAGWIWRPMASPSASRYSLGFLPFNLNSFLALNNQMTRKVPGQCWIPLE